MAVAALTSVMILRRPNPSCLKVLIVCLLFVSITDGQNSLDKSRFNQIVEEFGFSPSIENSDFYIPSVVGRRQAPNQPGPRGREALAQLFAVATSDSSGDGGDAAPPRPAKGGDQSRDILKAFNPNRGRGGGSSVAQEVGTAGQTQPAPQPPARPEQLASRPVGVPRRGQVKTDQTLTDSSQRSNNRAAIRVRGRARGRRPQSQPSQSQQDPGRQQPPLDVRQQQPQVDPIQPPSQRQQSAEVNSQAAAVPVPTAPAPTTPPRIQTLPPFSGRGAGRPEPVSGSQTPQSVPSQPGGSRQSLDQTAQLFGFRPQLEVLSPTEIVENLPPASQSPSLGASRTASSLEPASNGSPSNVKIPFTVFRRPSSTERLSPQSEVVTRPPSRPRRPSNSSPLDNLLEIAGPSEVNPVAEAKEAPRSSITDFTQDNFSGRETSPRLVINNQARTRQNRPSGASSNFGGNSQPRQQSFGATTQSSQQNFGGNSQPRQQPTDFSNEIPRAFNSDEVKVSDSSLTESERPSRPDPLPSRFNGPSTSSRDKVDDRRAFPIRTSVAKESEQKESKTAERKKSKPKSKKAKSSKKMKGSEDSSEDTSTEDSKGNQFAIEVDGCERVCSYLIYEIYQLLGGATCAC